MHKYRSQRSYQAGGMWEGDGKKLFGQEKKTPNTNSKLYTTTTPGPVGQEMSSGVKWRGGGGDWVRGREGVRTMTEHYLVLR